MKPDPATLAAALREEAARLGAILDELTDHDLERMSLDASAPEDDGA